MSTGITYKSGFPPSTYEQVCTKVQYYTYSTYSTFLQSFVLRLSLERCRLSLSWEKALFLGPTTLRPLVSEI